jgi:tetratricopeptide (TPR) repeat protein
MRPLFLLAILAFVTALLAFRFLPGRSMTSSVIQQTKESKKNIIRCSPDWNELEDWLAETDIPPMPGAGSYKWKITTSNDSAQFYFNQGINMYYSFHIIESMASFKKAARFDPNSAMIYWAQALAYGPNINDLGYAASPEALAATNKAMELSPACTDEEKALINAMTVRYTADSADVNRKKLNELYTAQMKAAYEKFPANPDIAALYADAMMLEHPWDLWSIDGTPKPWTPLIREVLEKLLLQAPNNPGANHYYIHVMEPSPFADKALPSADRLGTLTPGLSHTVHMPSHIYLRTGKYDKGVSVNEAAVKSYQRSIPLYEPVTSNAFLYIIHNLHMQTNNAMLAGRSGYSTKSAKETVNSIPADYLQIPGALGNYIQYIHMTPTLVDVRFGKWNNLLSATQPASSLNYANILWQFGRGMAYVQRSMMSEAKSALAQLQDRMKDTMLMIPLSPFSAAIDGAIVAENILIGTIAVKEKRYSDAIAAFEEAVVTEENMVYNEPRDWMLNPRQYLGNAYLKAGRIKEAKETFHQDLKNNAENGWSLFGLWQALTKEKKTAEAAKMLARFRKAFAKADVKLYGAVF